MVHVSARVVRSAVKLKKVGVKGRELLGACFKDREREGRGGETGDRDREGG